MTAEDFRAMAFSFPGAVEAPHFDRTSFRAKKKIFATMVPDGSEGMVRVGVDRALALIDERPEVFFSYKGYTTSFGALGVRLAKIKGAELRPLMQASYDAAVLPRPRAKSSGRTSAQRAKSSMTASSSRGRKKR